MSSHRFETIGKLGMLSVETTTPRYPEVDNQKGFDAWHGTVYAMPNLPADGVEAELVLACPVFLCFLPPPRPPLLGPQLPA